MGDGEMNELIDVKLKAVNHSEFNSLVLSSTKVITGVDEKVLIIVLNNGMLEVGHTFTWVELEHIRNVDTVIRGHVTRMERELLKHA
jgi:hypothetical protein